MVRLFGLSDLLRTLARTEIDFSAHLGGAVEWYSRAIDSLLKVSYFTGDLADSADDRDFFEFFALSHYQQAPYTFWSIYDLVKKGFYLEATILFRSLLEVFVQLRYFGLHSNKLKAYIKQESKITFRKLFEEISPGFYDKHYRYYSNWFAHGKGGHFAFRFESKNGDPEILLGNRYDEDSVAFVMNSVLPLLLGFFDFYPVFFPGNRLASDNALSEEVAKVHAYLRMNVDKHKESNPLSKELYATYEPLCRVGRVVDV